MKRTITTQDDQPIPGGEPTSLTATGVTTTPSSQKLADRVFALLAALRPQQWVKNLALFVGILFSQRLFVPSSFERTVLAFAAFCLASSGIYLLNDLLDLENDKQHPVKCKRPLASGKLPASWAIGAMGVLVLTSGGLTLLIFHIPVGQSIDTYAHYGGGNLLFVLTIASYLLLMVLYSVKLKHVVLLDVFIIAGGFFLRILAGAVAISVSISPWLYLVAILLSLFLALSKRRYELVILQEQAGSHRQNLKEYSLPMLDQMITIVTTATLMAYSLYTFLGLTGNHRLMLTIPLVLYGMFRYLYLIYMHKEGGSPEEVLLRDRHMLGTVLLCTVIIIIVLYVLPQ